MLWRIKQVEGFQGVGRVCTKVPRQKHTRESPGAMRTSQEHKRYSQLPILRPLPH